MTYDPNDTICLTCLNKINSIVKKEIESEKTFIFLMSKFRYKLRNNLYNWEKLFKYLLSHFVNLIKLSVIPCSKCKNIDIDKHLENCIIYQKISIYCIIFNSMTDKNIINISKKYLESNTKLNMTIKAKLNSINDIYSLMQCPHLWKGSNYYYNKLFGIPRILDNINIPKEHWIIKENSCLNDSICGHPKASHGWMRESIDQLEILDNTF